VSIKHAEAEVRLYDRLFIDEARTAIKTFEFKIQILEIVKGRRTKFSSSRGINFSSNVWVISIHKDSMPGKLVLIKQLD
jgi:hypothetical protein